MSATVVWLRRQRGGMRRVTPVVVRVVGKTPGGYFVVEYTRRHRTIRRIVAPKNIRPLVEFNVETAA